MEYLRVKNWAQFQHYKDRNPPWIKLHFALLTSSDWVTLNDASRVLAVACMLLASKKDGLIPNRPEYIQRVAYLHSIPDFNPLIECGFLEVASTLQADARPEERREEAEKRRAGASAPRVDKSTKANGNGGAWWKTAKGIEEKGKALNVKTRPGESHAEYKERIFQAIKA